MIIKKISNNCIMYLIIFLSIIYASLFMACDGAANLKSDIGSVESNKISMTENEVIWAMTYGGSKGDCANTIEVTSDGGYIAAGYTRSFGQGSSDNWVVKIDSEGNLEWSNAYGENKPEFVYSIKQTSEGGYITAGDKRKYSILDEFNLTSSYKYDMWIVKLNSTGEEEWKKSYGGKDYDRANSIALTTDGGYIVAGHSQSYGAEYNPKPHAKKDLWILKLDSEGNIEWEQLYGKENGSDGANSVQQTIDGGYILAGFTSSYGAGCYDCWILKLDSIGNIEWTKTFGGVKKETANSILQTTDEGYIIAGETWSFGSGNTDYYILKLDSAGNIIWEKTFGDAGFERAKSIKQTADNGYIIAGYTNSTGAGNKDALIIRLDTNGNEIWSKTYGGASCDMANSIQLTNDNSYIIAGNTSSFGTGEIDFWIFKIDEIK